MTNLKEQIDVLVEQLKAQGYKNVCFFQPAYAVTGGVICKVQMAKYLANHTDLNVYFCDFPDGYPHELIKDEKNIHFLPYNPRSADFPFMEKCAIFATSTRVILLQKMHPANKLIFWHNETVRCAWEIVLVNGKIKSFFNLAKKNKAMFFHDWSSRDSLNRYNQASFINDDFYYVTVDEKKKEVTKKLTSNKYINVAFLSRLSSDKIQSLFYLAHNLYNMDIDKKIRLHVIGDGLCMTKVQNELKQYADKLEIIYTGTVAHDKLDAYLIRNIDLLFGVGTCTIESAALKLPTAVLLMSTQKITENEAFWYHNTKDYCVGITVEQKKDFNIHYDTIEQMILDIARPKAKQEIGQKCYDFFKQNHGNYEKLVVNFLSQILKSSLTFKKLKKCIKYVPYSLLNIKTLRVFGVELFKAVTMREKTYFYFLGIKFLKKVKLKQLTKYYLFGIKAAKFQEKVPFKFPNAMRKEIKNAN